MKLQTKLVLGFTLVLLMTLGLGITSYYLTNNMSVYSAQAAYLDNGKNALLKVQGNYLRFVVYGEESFAKAAMKELEGAIQHFESCLPLIMAAENRRKVEDGIKQAQGLGESVARWAFGKRLVIISFLIAYEIYIVNLILPVFFQTPTLQHFLLFLHFILHILFILHHRIK